jgi:putative phage-type endonuclease
MSNMNRVGFIGGSDLAAIIGLSKWKSPYQLYLEKIEEPFEQETLKKQQFFECRKLAEPYILSVQQFKDGITPTNTNRRFTDCEHDFFSSEIDFEYHDDEFGSEQNGEIKTVTPYDHSGSFGQEWTNEIPEEYLCQAQWNLGVTKRQKCRMIVMSHWDDFRRYIIYRDDELINLLRKEALIFWERIQSKCPPPPSTVSDFKIRTPNKISVTANDEAIELVERIKNLKKSSKELDSLEEDLKLFIGDAEILVDSSGRQIASWKQQETRRTNLSDLEIAHPEIVRQFKSTTKTRVLRFNK